MDSEIKDSISHHRDSSVQPTVVTRTFLWVDECNSSLDLPASQISKSLHTLSLITALEILWFQD